MRCHTKILMFSELVAACATACTALGQFAGFQINASCPDTVVFGDPVTFTTVVSNSGTTVWYGESVDDRPSWGCYAEDKSWTAFYSEQFRRYAEVLPGRTATMSAWLQHPPETIGVFSFALYAYHKDYTIPPYPGYTLMTNSPIVLTFEIVPRPTTLTLQAQSESTLSLTITNLSPGATNYVELSDDLTVGHWWPVTNFMTESMATNVPVQMTNNQRRAFWRVKSK